MGLQGHFLHASRSTQQSKHNLFRGEALRRLSARARRQTISTFEPLILLRVPLTNFGWSPRTKCNLRKIGMRRRVPGLPISNCAGRCNNLVPRGIKVSARDVTQKVFFECLYWFQDWPYLRSESNCSCTPTPPLFS